MNTDPLADLLTRIRNAGRARLARVDIPLSKIKLRVVEILKREGYIEDFRVIAKVLSGQGMIEVKLRPGAIADIQRVSKPGSRRYFRAKNVNRVKQGLAMLILTTDRGVMSDREAREHGIGGEPICEVWS